MYIEYIPLLKEDSPKKSYAKWGDISEEDTFSITEKTTAFKDMKKWINTFKIDKSPSFNMSFDSYNAVAVSRKTAIEIIDEQLALLEEKRVTSIPDTEKKLSERAAELCSAIAELIREKNKTSNRKEKHTLIDEINELTLEEKENIEKQRQLKKMLPKIQIIVIEDKKDEPVLKKKNVRYLKEFSDSFDVDIPTINIKFSLYYFLLPDNMFLLLPAIKGKKEKTFISMSRPMELHSENTSEEEIKERCVNIAENLKNKEDDLRWVTAGSKTLSMMHSGWKNFSSSMKELINNQLLLLLKFRLCDEKTTKEKNLILKEFAKGNIEFMKEYVQKHYKEQ